MKFAATARKNGHKVKVFLMGEAVEIESISREKFNVPIQTNAFVGAGGEILACGSCLKSRDTEGSDTCPISTMNDCVNMVEWADKITTF